MQDHERGNCSALHGDPCLRRPHVAGQGEPYAHPVAHAVGGAWCARICPAISAAEGDLTHGSAPWPSSRGRARRAHPAGRCSRRRGAHASHTAPPSWTAESYRLTRAWARLWWRGPPTLSQSPGRGCAHRRLCSISSSLAGDPVGVYGGENTCTGWAFERFEAGGQPGSAGGRGGEAVEACTLAYQLAAPIRCSAVPRPGWRGQHGAVEPHASRARRIPSGSAEEARRESTTGPAERLEDHPPATAAGRGCRWLGSALDPGVGGEQLAPVPDQLRVPGPRAARSHLRRQAMGQMLGVNSYAHPGGNSALACWGWSTTRQSVGWLAITSSRPGRIEAGAVQVEGVERLVGDSTVSGRFSQARIKAVDTVRGSCTTSPTRAAGAAVIGSRSIGSRRCAGPRRGSSWRRPPLMVEADGF